MTDTSSWDLVQDLIARASELGTAERKALLDAECPELLRDEVEDLLAALEDDAELPGAHLAENLIDQFAAPPADDVDTLSPGQTIGHFTVVHRVGRGGMGEVYEAEQHEPVRRRVALKVVRATADSSGMLRRLERERRVLARMEHPGIAQVFEAGATDDGRPWVAMELVDGQPITEYCRQCELPLRPRIELFVRICRAVQHAHVKGVLHRDLKPSNILVVEVDAVPLPKVIDFGIAKALGPETELLPEQLDQTGETRLGQVIGTPEYMSPEQADLFPDLDTRSDVYSLGVVLYELLAGRTPWTAPRSRLNLEELQREIRTASPRAPSEQFSPGPRAAGIDRDSPRPAARRLPRELDWITLRALALDPDQRYENPADLADDLERFLRNEPVNAAPTGTGYRLHKWTQRHRTAAVLGPLGVAVLVGFAATSRMQYQRTERALQRAEAESAKANEVSAFLTELLQENDPNVSRGEPRTVATLLDEGARRLLDDEAAISSQPDLRASLLGILGHIYSNSGNYAAAIPLLERTDRLLQESVAQPSREATQGVLLLGLIYGNRGEFQLGREMLDRALELHRETFGPNSAEVADSYDALGNFHRMHDEFEQAATAHRTAQEMRRRLGLRNDSVAESHNLLGIALRNLGDLDGAIEQYEFAIDTMEQLHGPGFPPITQVRSNLALAQHVHGDFQAARTNFEQLLPEIERIKGSSHPDLAATRANYAALLIDFDQFEAAEHQLDEALAIRRASGQEESLWFANELSQRATARAGRGDLELARQDAERVITLRKQLFGDDHVAVGNAYVRLAEIDRLEEKWEPAALHYDNARTIFQQADLRYPSAIVAFEHGLMLLERGEAGAALSHFENASELNRDVENRPRPVQLAQRDALRAAVALAAGINEASTAREWSERLSAHDASRLRQDPRQRLARVRHLLAATVNPPRTHDDRADS